jgi:hypothetical protein
MNKSEVQEAIDLAVDLAKTGGLIDGKFLSQALIAVAAERDFFRGREQDIINATDPLDGGRYRDDIVLAILRQREELDNIKKESDDLRSAMETIVADYGGRASSSDLGMDLHDAAERAYLDGSEESYLRVAATAMLLRKMARGEKP